ncbi:MAG: hypothetical protein LC104_00160 [Bacteroidales bacterium]|nr:hypothetical protein [Bacteroidales bacterium]
MLEPARPSGTASSELALTALRFAAGELSAPATTAFAARVAADPLAQNALEEALRLSAAALGQSLPTPDPLVREGVRDRIRPGFFSRIFPRRPYHGHPITWAGLGGSAAVVLTIFGVWLGESPAPPPVHPPLVMTAPASDLSHVSPDPSEFVPVQTGPRVWVSREPLPPPTVIVEMPPRVEPTHPSTVLATVPKPVDLPVTSVAEPEARGHEPRAAITHDGSAPAQ